MEMPMESSKPASIGKRFTGILLNPKQTFEEIAQHPNWGWALLIITLINLACTLLTIPKLKIFLMETMQQQAQQNPALNTPEMAHFAETSGLIGAIIGAMLVPAITCLIFALLLKIFNAFSGEKMPFRRFYAVSVYAYIPVLFTLLIQTVVIILSAHPDFAGAPSSLYAFFPSGATGFAANFAKQVEPFFLWSLYLLALGGSTLIRKPVRNTALYIFILWVIYALLIASKTAALA